MPGRGVAMLLSGLRHDPSIARPALASPKLVQDIERELAQEIIAGSNASGGQMRRE